MHWITRCSSGAGVLVQVTRAHVLQCTANGLSTCTSKFYESLFLFLDDYNYTSIKSIYYYTSCVYASHTQLATKLIAILFEVNLVEEYNCTMLVACLFFF